MTQTIELHPSDEHNRTLTNNVHPPDWQNPTPASTYNLVVIGGGSAGLVAAAGAASLGAGVALIERHLLGGDCLNVGCVPSKTIVRSARMLSDVRRADQFGINMPEDSGVDFARVMERMRRVRAGISEDDSVQRFVDLGVDVFLGEGHFTGLNTIEVAGQTLNFKKAAVATGSRPAGLPIEGLDGAGYLTNETFFELTEQPARLAVIGAGPIGAELAQAMARFGSEVTAFDVMSRVLPDEDEDAVRIVRRRLEEDGVQFVLPAEIRRVAIEDGEKVLYYEHDDEEHRLAVDEILIAAGRAPNVEGLNLGAAAVDYDENGIFVNDTLQTTNPDVYAAGDVALTQKFTHTADAAARIVLQNALFPGPKRKYSDLVIPWVTYTDPEIAHVGMYPEDANDAGIAVDTYAHPMEDTDRGRADGVEDGFVKIHVKSGTDQILGATIVAPHAGDLISEITLAMKTGAGLRAIADTIHPYPTQAGAIKQAADSYTLSRLTPLLARALELWFRFTR